MGIDWLLAALYNRRALRRDREIAGKNYENERK